MEVSHLLTPSSPSPSVLPRKSSLFRALPLHRKPLNLDCSNLSLNSSELRAMESRTTPRASLVDDNGSPSTTTASQPGSGEWPFYSQPRHVNLRFPAPRQRFPSPPALKTQIQSREALLSRRSVLPSIAASAVAIIALDRSLMAPLARAEDQPSSQDKGDVAGVIGAVKSLFDPDEKTKSGKVLPKAYLRSARDVVKNLRESLTKDTNSAAEFRRVADAAKESIRDYLGNWRGNQAVAKEESYVVLEKAIRSLAGFYSNAGPSASLSEEVKSEILNYLNTADESL